MRSLDQISRFADKRVLAANGDLYVDDAFSVAHRVHASTEGSAHLLASYAGLSVQRELKQLERALRPPRHPFMGIVGGSKISSKIDLLKTLVTKLDRLAVGGALANTFLFAKGWGVGASYYEKELAETALEIERLARANECEILLPVNVIVARELELDAPFFVRRIGEVEDDERILDAGPETLARLRQAMKISETLIWNGPIGAFETAPFDRGIVDIARTAAEMIRRGNLISLAGGGDTVSALNHAGIAADFTFVSTAGGAFLEWVGGATLPGVAVLMN